MSRKPRDKDLYKPSFPHFIMRLFDLVVGRYFAGEGFNDLGGISDEDCFTTIASPNSFIACQRARSSAVRIESISMIVWNLLKIAVNTLGVT